MPDGELSRREKLSMLKDKPQSNESRILWDRPYADPGGNSKVEFYVDLLPDGYCFSLLLYKKTLVTHDSSDTKDTISKQANKGGYETIAMAEEFAIERYGEILKEQVIQHKRWAWFTYKDWGPIAIAILVFIGVMTVVIVMGSFILKLFFH